MFSPRLTKKYNFNITINRFRTFDLYTVWDKDFFCCMTFDSQEEFIKFMDKNRGKIWIALVKAYLEYNKNESITRFCDTCMEEYEKLLGTEKEESFTTRVNVEAIEGNTGNIPFDSSSEIPKKKGEKE